jgi:Lrp/AsnC family transcriptional regulator, leucine-responsive regulatory protein
MKLDQIDRKILAILQENGNITNAQLAKDVGLSPAPTLERVKKLEQSGIIASYHAELNKEKIGLGVCIFVLVTLSSHKMNQINAFIQKINNIPEVVECHHITGQGDFLLKILTKDIPTYQSLILDTLSQIEEIGNMRSMVNLNTYKSSKVIPIMI